MDWEPRICWQRPLFFEIDDKTMTTVVRACRAFDWGGEGIVDWWCMEHSNPFSADHPVHLTMEGDSGACAATLSTTSWPPTA